MAYHEGEDITKLSDEELTETLRALGWIEGMFSYSFEFHCSREHYHALMVERDRRQRASDQPLPFPEELQ